ncbi:MAG: MotA/TolQ/ExbB proton channel family protein [Bacteroidales bacterium]|nr:MotA/TolQ/ExbB proton channel family protein [Bacteroidales bacterium]
MDSLSFWSLVIDGGYIMIPLAILLLLTIYIFTERCIAIQRSLNDDPTFMKRIRDYVHEADLESAVRLCKNTDTPYSRMILKGLQRIGRPTQDVMTAIENSGNLEIANLGKGLPWLSTTAAGAPMLGFLGTVVGMIQAFYTLAKAGAASNITLLSGGIYQALVTTVAGLVVGIIALFAYNYLVARINRVMNRMEARSIEFMDLLNEPA